MVFKRLLAFNYPEIAQLFPQCVTLAETIQQYNSEIRELRGVTNKDLLIKLCDDTVVFLEPQSDVILCSNEVWCFRLLTRGFSLVDTFGMSDSNTLETVRLCHSRPHSFLEMIRAEKKFITLDCSEVNSSAKLIEVDYLTNTVFKDQEKIYLTYLEFLLFSYLIFHPNRPIGREELIENVWSDKCLETEKRKIDIHVGRIRKKIGDEQLTIIGTLYRRGYMLNITPLFS